MDTITPTPLLGPRELAAQLAITRAHIYRLVAEAPQQLPPRVQLPGSRRLRWRQADVDDWIAAHVQQSSDQQPRRRGRPTRAEELARAAAR